MQVLFVTRDPELGELRPLAVRRVRFAMRRLSWLVRRVKVRLYDINGPRGGVDKRCQLEVQTDGAGTVVVTSLAVDPRDALDAAVSRAAKVLLRDWRRQRGFTRQVASSGATGS